MPRTLLANAALLRRCLLPLIALLALAAIACGAAEEAAPAVEQTAPSEVAQPAALEIPATQAPAPQESMAKPAESMESQPADTTAKTTESMESKPAQAAAAPTTAPQPTAAPQAPVVSARDRLIFVTNEEPTTIGAASPNCGGNIQNTICDDMVSDPLTWIDDHNNFQVVGLTGIEGWEQVAGSSSCVKASPSTTAPHGTPSRPSSGLTSSATRRPAATTTPTTSASTASSAARLWTNTRWISFAGRPAPFCLVPLSLQNFRTWIGSWK